MTVLRLATVCNLPERRLLQSALAVAALLWLFETHYRKLVNRTPLARMVMSLFVESL